MRKSLKLLMATFTVCSTLYLLACNINAATYYVSGTTGNDSRTAVQAQSTSTPWKTISKAASVMVAGDTCSIMAGTYRETITPINSGTDSAKITYTNYNNGKVIVSGTDLLTGWTQHSGSIFKASVSLNLGNGNQLFVNGEMINEARWPNNTSTQLLQPTLAIADAGTTTSISDAELTQSNDFWNGATLWCLSGTGWVSQRLKVNDFDAASHTLMFNSFTTDGSHYCPKAGNKYYLTGLMSCLDSQKEWYYDSGKSTMYLWAPAGVNPSVLNVEVKKRYYGFNLSGRSNINITGINFWATGIKTDSLTANCVFDKVTAQYVTHGTSNSGGIDLLGSGLELRNSTVEKGSKYLLNIAGTNNKVINCLIQDGNYDASWNEIVEINGGSNHLISHNTIREAGRACLGINSYNSQIQFNDIYNAGRLTTDLGIIYQADADGGNTRIHHNLVHDNLSPYAGLGIYLDAFTQNYIVDHNVVWGCYDALRWNIPSENHIAYNNTLTGTHSSIDHYGNKYPYNMYGCRAFNNIFTNIIKTTGGSVFGYNLNKGIDPLFVDPLNNNYRLKSNSPAINAGTRLIGVTTGNIGNPDIGAYEYGGTDWKAGHDFANPPNPIFADTNVPYMNLVKNAGFETGDLKNWEGIGSDTGSVISGSAWKDYTGNVKSNVHSVRLGGTTSPVGVRQTITGLTPNTTYVASAWLKVENASEKIELGAKTSGGSNVTKGTSSLSWDQVTVEFTTSSTETSATIYVWKYTTGTTYAYADVFALTAKDDRARSDSFESGFADWTHYPYDVPATTGTVTHNGSMSYKVDDDYDSIGKNLRASHNKIVTVWFYDYKTTRDDSMHVVARVDDGMICKGLGVSTGRSTTHYCFRNGDNYTPTSVARSPGWHEFKFDYMTGDDLKMYIDGTLVYTSKDVTSFSYIMLGDWFRDSKSCTESYFDDLKILDVDTIQ